MCRPTKALLLLTALLWEGSGPPALAFQPSCTVSVPFFRRRRKHTKSRDNSLGATIKGSSSSSDDNKDSVGLPILEKPIQKLKEIDFRNGFIFGDQQNKATTERKASRLRRRRQETPLTDFDFSAYANNFVKLFRGEQEKDEAIMDIVSKARDAFTQSDVSDKRSFSELLATFETYASLMGKVNDRYLSSIDWSLFDPTSLYYALEYQDEVKNPSWKRRQHRFMPGVDMEEVLELNDYGVLAHMCYADSTEELQERLANHTTPCELVTAELESEPGKPASYLAIPLDQSSNGDALEVILGVRGTKSIADAMTDLICTDEDYRGGKAHSYMLRSGKFLVERYKDLLEELLKLSEKTKLVLKLTGHSLGAGAAAIAGIELQDHPDMEVEVFGFGSPAMLSEELAVQASFITTVVNDQDAVPRLSGVTVANLMRDVLEFDYVHYADRDVHETIEAFHASHPNLLGTDLLGKVREVVTSYVEEYARRRILTKTKDRYKPNLFPPGRCIHFYRDGVGFSANEVPNTFFSEIDVTRRMLDDHIFATGYEQTFLEVMREHRGDPHFRFEEATTEPDGDMFGIS